MMRRNKTMCKNRKKYTTAKMAGEFMGICSRTFKSFLFNVLIFTLGFAACYVYAVQKINRQATAMAGSAAGRSEECTSIDSSLKRFKVSVFIDSKNRTNNCAIVR